MPGGRSFGRVCRNLNRSHNQKGGPAGSGPRVSGDRDLSRIKRQEPPPERAQKGGGPWNLPAWDPRPPGGGARPQKPHDGANGAGVGVLL